MTALVTTVRIRNVLARPRTAARIPWLALVAVAYAGCQLLLVGPHLGLNWDETVFVSQVDPRRPAAFFSAPRSRGISLLVAPVLAVTDSVTVLRIALALLSAAALWAAYRVWRPLIGPRRTALAAALFAGLWTTVLYGPQAMPNLWVALSSVAAVGWFLRVARGDAPPYAPCCLAVAVAAATCFRFSDGVWLTMPLLAACLLVRAWRRPLTLLALFAGLAAGSAQWIVEAYLRWGGVGARLHASSATEGGMGLHWAVPLAWHSLNGPLLCRPCHVPLTHPALTVWWLLLPLLIAAACLAALRRPRASVTLLPVATALVLSVPYLLLIDYSAPRFLLPAYALLAPALATLTARILRAVRPGTARTVTACALAALFAAQLASQYVVLHAETAKVRAVADRDLTIAHRLNRLGVTPPCVISGRHAPPVGYDAGCASENVGGNNSNTTARAVRRTAAYEPTAALAPARSGPPSYARGWIRYELPGTGLTAYLRLPVLDH